MIATTDRTTTATRAAKRRAAKNGINSMAQSPDLKMRYSPDSAGHRLAQSAMFGYPGLTTGRQRVLVAVWPGLRSPSDRGFVRAESPPRCATSSPASLRPAGCGFRSCRKTAATEMLVLGVVWSAGLRSHVIKSAATEGSSLCVGLVGRVAVARDQGRCDGGRWFVLAWGRSPFSPFRRFASDEERGSGACSGPAAVQSPQARSPLPGCAPAVRRPRCLWRRGVAHWQQPGSPV